MIKRTKLSDRKLPNYTKGEERMNTVTHIIGGLFALAALILCVIRAALHSNVAGIIGSAIYGTTMVLLYAVSSVYHGMPVGTGKKVMQVVDHCSIYFLISGTYTSILLSAFLPVCPAICRGLLAAEWLLTIIATVLTAIDLKKYRIFSMICYIGMGWLIVLYWKQTVQVLTGKGFMLLLSGGIAYSIGAILYKIGHKRHWYHGVFHIFVVLGSLLQFLAIYFYAL